LDKDKDGYLNDKELCALQSLVYESELGEQDLKDMKSIISEVDKDAVHNKLGITL
jgi:hypothetical protein